MKIFHYFILTVLYFLSYTAYAYNLSLTTYANDSRMLAIPTIKVGNMWYNNLVIQLDTIQVISYGSKSSASLPEDCAPITRSGFGAIQVGMTLDQVDAVLGCQHFPLYLRDLNNYIAVPEWITVQWGASGYAEIAVIFDRDGKFVVNPFHGNSTGFKSCSFFTCQRLGLL